MVTRFNSPSGLCLSVWWKPLERRVIDFSRGSNQNGETLIKVRKVVSLLWGVDDRSGISGENVPEYKVGPCACKNMHGGKSDPCVDVQQKHRRMYLRGPKSLSSKDRAARSDLSHQHSQPPTSLRWFLM